MKLQKYKLKASIRKQFDNLSDEDKVLFGFENFNDPLVLGKIFTYYGLENHPLLRTLSLDKFATNPTDAYCFAVDVIKDRWIEAEHIIKTDPYCAFYYSRHVIKDRWVEAEDMIKTDPYRAYEYAFHVIKGRWIKAENTIKTDPLHSYHYAKYVIKGRWIEAEDIIKTNKELWDDYQKKFIT